MQAPRVTHLIKLRSAVHVCRSPTARARFSTSSPFRRRFDLKNKNVLITGGGRGIGYGITRGIAEMGGNVIVLDVLPEPVKDFERLSKELNVRAKYAQIDITDEKAMTRVFDETAAEFGTLDGCVTAAGILPGCAFVDQSIDVLRRVLDVNIVGTYLTAQLATKQMIKQGTGGSIVMIASIGASETVPGAAMSAYNASKAGVKMLASALSTELGPHQIRVNSISPGTIQTDILKPFLEADPNMERIVTTTPALKRMGDRNDITPAAVYLLSNASGFTTGLDMLITGGLHGGRLDA
ncbi:NAD(P)-binding protein [Aspergillus pseudoustus]|uniref:NAD(P)-binding protein n=1 Tax=Aspergillus pseudoustus TaxID=1810923 RepID=A0ABR4JWA6_9EURO